MVLGSLFAFFRSALLWAIATHFEKDLVERYFKHNDVAVLLPLSPAIGLLDPPFHRLLRAPTGL